MSNPTTADARTDADQIRADVFRAAADAIADFSPDTTRNASGMFRRMERDGFDAAMGVLRGVPVAERPDGIVSEVDELCKVAHDGRDAAVEALTEAAEDAAPAQDEQDDDDGDAGAGKVAALTEGQTVTVMERSATITTTSRREQFCADCDGMARMPRAIADVDGVDMQFHISQCPHCSGIGHEVHAVRGGKDAPRFGVVALTHDEEDERLLALRAEGTPVWLENRADEEVTA